MRTGRAALLYVLAAPFLASGTQAQDAPARPAPIPASGVHGVVRGEALAPLAGAEISAAPKGLTVLKVTTDSRGAYSLVGLPTGKVTLLVRAKGYQSAEVRVAVSPTAAAQADATLKPGIVYSGQVVDSRGAPLKDVRVRPIVQRVPGTTLGWQMLADPEAATVTQEDGRFLVDRLVPGLTYVVRFQHPHYAIHDEDGVPSEAGAAKSDVRVELQDAAWISGVVRDEHGVGVAGARVFGPPSPQWPRGDVEGAAPTTELLDRAWARTDAAGRFLLGGFGAAESELIVYAKGCFVETSTVEGLEIGKERRDAELRVEHGTSVVSGSIVDKRGRPIPFPVARLVNDREDAFVWGDSKGAFSLEDIHLRGTFKLKTSAPQFVSSVSDVEVPAKGLRVALDRAPVWQGRVTDAAGSTIPQVTFAVRQLDGEWPDAAEWLLADVVVSQGQGGCAVVLPVGQASIAVGAPGYEAKAIGPFSTAVEEVIDGGVVSLSAAAR